MAYTDNKLYNTSYITLTINTTHNTYNNTKQHNTIPMLLTHIQSIHVQI